MTVLLGNNVGNMDCNCVKEFGFNIVFNTCKKMLYQDASIWVDTPDNYEILITTPAGQTVAVTVSSLGVTVIDSIVLGISTEQQNLPAGIYCIKYINCNGDTIYKDYLNLCIYECQLANLLATVDLSKCNNCLESELKHYRYIKYLLDGAKAKFECDWCSNQEVKDIITHLKTKLTEQNCTCG